MVVTRSQQRKAGEEGNSNNGEGRPSKRKAVLLLGVLFLSVLGILQLLSARLPTLDE